MAVLKRKKKQVLSTNHCQLTLTLAIVVLMFLRSVTYC